MDLEMTRISNKGQVVIPGRIREELGLDEGTRLLVFGEGDTLILKKVTLGPGSSTREALESLRRRVKALGLSKEDVAAEIRKVRAGRRKRAS
ncbi:AbrB/MazE/SpoVT family DNA-binding domain-containing protein [Candidatus Bathyarchaeota archaeon]|nr:MAG: AbrB/MazE/SpoVT family DNA-binding domain-containing protein [Candidatus Bathyarchaeota archaeon]